MSSFVCGIQSSSKHRELGGVRVAGGSSTISY